MDWGPGVYRWVGELVSAGGLEVVSAGRLGAGG